MINRQFSVARAWINIAAAGAILAPAMSAWGVLPPRYLAQQAGLVDAAHTSPAGVRISTLQVAASGVLAGTSVRWEADGTTGQSAWVFRAGQTVRIGLGAVDPAAYTVDDIIGVSATGAAIGSSRIVDPETQRWVSIPWMWDGSVTRRIGLRENGAKPSAAQFAGEAVIGTSELHASEHPGRAAWVESGGAVTRLGLFDAEHTLDGGMQESQVWTYGGSVTGVSSRVHAGQSAWVFSGGQSIRIGLWDEDHTDAATSQQWSTPVGGNARGDVVGRSTRFAEGGQSAWVMRNGATQRIGLTDSAHTYLGMQWSSPVAINSAGWVIGFSSVGVSVEDFSTAWLFADGQTTQMGLRDAEHTDALGAADSMPLAINDRGDVIGTSRRPGGDLGRSAWQFRNGVTVRIGLFDTEHTGPFGERASVPKAMNERGDVIGTSRIYGELSDLSSSWVVYDGVTRRIGLTGPEYKRRSDVLKLNEAGDVVGTTERIEGAGQGSLVVPWVYSKALDRTYPLVFAIGPENQIETNVVAIDNAGVVYGAYVEWPAEGRVSRVFAWSPTLGLRRFADLASCGEAASAWGSTGTPLNHFAFPVPMNTDSLAGEGVLVGVPAGSKSLYVLSKLPVCPCDIDRRNCGVEPQDLLTFLDAYFSRSALADLDEDGEVEPTDLFVFLTCFFGSCP